MKIGSKKLRNLLIIILVLVVAIGIFYHQSYRHARQAKQILEQTGTTGGLVVHLGFDDGRLTAALAQNDRIVVHGLSRNIKKVARARKQIQHRDLYGKVSVERLNDDKLPYTDNLVNCLIAENTEGISRKEILRVLAPNGVAYIKRDNQWKRTVASKSEKIDDWTHHLHAADGNPVSQDETVGPPGHYQWIADPLWLRSHESHSSISSIVTSNGRMFYFENESPISLAGNNGVPNKWVLKARDAHNGIALWKKALKDWGWREWKDTWFLPRPGLLPINIHRRLVAIGDKVYVTLGYHSPVYQLDARSGDILKEYPETENTYEILYHQGNLILTVNQDDRLKMMVVDAETGDIAWQTEPRFQGTKVEFIRWKPYKHRPIEPSPLNPVFNAATDGNIISLIDTNTIVGLDYQTGEELWRTSMTDGWQYDGWWQSHFANQGMHQLWPGTLIIKDGVVLHASPDKLGGISAETGELLWANSKEWIGWLWFEWKDVFVSNGLVWTWSSEIISADRSKWPRYMRGYDLHTGKTVKEIPLDSIFAAPHHHRCYRNKATEQYIIASRRGAEFINLKNGELDVNNWVRGTCHYGMLPANGLLYAPPHPCVCFSYEKLKAFNALAPATSKQNLANDTTSRKCVHGPAYGNASGEKAAADDWPTYRHDPIRSGSVPIEMKKKLELRWEKQIDGKLSPPTVVGERMYVSIIDQYKVAAYRTKDGKQLWEYVTGGRVDSPPTYYQGKVLFGSVDGHVYCLRASDGKLVWKYQAAPAQRYMMAFDRLESCWPVHGSIMVQNGTAYFAAGRSSHLDSGIYVYGLDPDTGKLLHYREIKGPGWKSGRYTSNLRPPQGAKADILQGDGEHVYMRHLAFDADFSTVKTENNVLDFKKENQSGRVRARGGFLDDTYFKRAHWYFGHKRNWSRIIVNNGNTFYGVKMWETLDGLNPDNFFTPGKKGYQLYKRNLDGIENTWTQYIPIRVKAMTLTEKHLFIAGPPDVLGKNDPLGAFEGRKGGIFAIVSCENGEQIARNKLDSPPVFNGMAAARGQLYLALQNGKLMCLGIE